MFELTFKCDSCKMRWIIHHTNITSIISDLLQSAKGTVSKAVAIKYLILVYYLGVNMQPFSLSKSIQFLKKVELPLFLIYFRPFWISLHDMFPSLPKLIPFDSNIKSPKWYWSKWRVKSQEKFIWNFFYPLSNLDGAVCFSLSRKAYS